MPSGSAGDGRDHAKLEARFNVKRGFSSRNAGAAAKQKGSAAVLATLPLMIPLRSDG
jgi:hypothetical protein